MANANDSGDRLRITSQISIPMGEIQLSAVRSQGPGGQNVNKVASAIHLRFDIQASSLSCYTKKRLLNYRDHRITKDGIIVVKAQQSRSQEQNKRLALERLCEIIRLATQPRKIRKVTRPTRSSVKKRLDRKTRNAQVKNMRKKPSTEA